MYFFKSEMTSNQHKFIDRSPSILPAGKPSDNFGNSVANTLREYTVDDAAHALKVVAQIDDNASKPKYKSEPYKNSMRCGIYTNIRPILQPGVKTRYEFLINELKETTYDSHWNKVVGKGRDPVPGLPRGLDPVTTTFGKESCKDESAKELINPPKGVYQVLTESQIAHELYRKSHNDYNIGEKVCRNYEPPSFDSRMRFGGKTKYDPRGIWVRCACTWHVKEPVVYSNKHQADFFKETKHRLGKCLTPNNILENVPKGFIFGRFYKKDLYSVGDLLKDADCPPCLFKRDLKCWMSSFNRLKSSIRKQLGPELNFGDLYKKLLYYDVDNCGDLPLEVFYKVCACYRFALDREKLEPLMRLLSVICEDKINYGNFLELLGSNAPPLELMKINDVPEQNQYYVTTSQAACCDYLIINNSNHPPAGIPSMRYDLDRPIVPNGGCRADLENLGDECSAGLLTNPSVYLNYGLSFRDFLIPREAPVIRGLFENIGYKFDNETFDKLWKIGVERDKTGLVCVETFNKLLQSHYAQQRKIIVDEATC